MTRTGAGRASFCIGARDLLFFSLIRRLQLEHRAQELSDPFAFLSHLVRPVPAHVVAVPAAARSPGAKTTMQTTALAGLLGRVHGVVHHFSPSSPPLLSGGLGL